MVEAEDQRAMSEVELELPVRWKAWFLKDAWDIKVKGSIKDVLTRSFFSQALQVGAANRSVLPVAFVLNAVVSTKVICELDSPNRTLKLICCASSLASAVAALEASVNGGSASRIVTPQVGHFQSSDL